MQPKLPIDLKRKFLSAGSYLVMDYVDEVRLKVFKVPLPGSVYEETAFSRMAGNRL